MASAILVRPFHTANPCNTWRAFDRCEKVDLRAKIGPCDNRFDDIFAFPDVANVKAGDRFKRCLNCYDLNSVPSVMQSA
jgi:hypothetical protein